MAIYLIDSSALVKRYIKETGSAWVLGLFASTSHEFFIATITGVEIVAAIARRARGRSISAADATMICNQFKSDLQTDYQIVEITESIITKGMVLAQTYGLRGYDAIQLAAGIAVNSLCITHNLPTVTFVCADNELNAAVLGEGLVIENPNSHP
jgi:uncharacterized protein